MKKKNLLIAFGLLVSIAAKAQTTLPYSTGFDNATDVAGWMEYREGVNTYMDWTLNKSYAIIADTSVPSPPDCLVHDYPEGTSLTDDWMVSPQLDMSKGGYVSLKAYVFSMTVSSSGSPLAPGDSLQMYLLKGSGDPMAASKELLFSFQPNDSTKHYAYFQDIKNVPIAATTDKAYLAIRYTCINDWYWAGIDNIVISSAATSAVNNVQTNNAAIRLYPNPAKKSIYWKVPLDLKQRDAKAMLYNVTGQLLATFPAAAGQYDVHTLQEGVYFLHIGNTISSFIKE